MRARVTEISWSRTLGSTFAGYALSIAAYMLAMSFEARLDSFWASVSNASRTLPRTALASSTTSSGIRMMSSRAANLGSASPFLCRWLVSREVTEPSLARRTGHRQTCSLSPSKMTSRSVDVLAMRRSSSASRTEPGR